VIPSILVFLLLSSASELQRRAFANCDPTLRVKLLAAAPQLLSGHFRTPEAPDFDGDWLTFGLERCAVQVHADFNGDGRDDWIFLLIAEGFRLAGLISQADGASVGVVLRDEPENQHPTRYILGVAEPGEYESAYAKGYEVEPAPESVRLAFKGVWFSLAESIDWLYFWDPQKGGFACVQTSD